MLGDGVFPWAIPTASDPTPSNLILGRIGTMETFAIPRHGRTPNPVPTVWAAYRPLPGAVNVAFFDSHVELVKLDRLWQLYWHVGYQPPAKRPGLP